MVPLPPPFTGEVRRGFEAKAKSVPRSLVTRGKFYLEQPPSNSPRHEGRADSGCGTVF
jgi:hypothetical protein